MSKLPLVSVIIVNYNGKEHLAECLASLIQTKYPRFEIIVVDNNSTDGSKQYLKKLASRNLEISSSDIRRSREINFSPEASGRISNFTPTSVEVNFKVLFNKKNFGFAAANNQAAQIAQGEKLIFLNPDTLPEKNWLRNLVSFSLKNQKILVQPKILCWPRKNIIDNVGGIYRFPGFGFGRGQGQKDQGQFDQPSRVDYVNGTCFLIDKDFFWQLGGFDESFFLHYEDVDLCLRAKKHNGQCWTCPSSIIYHQGSQIIKTQIKRNRLLFFVRKNQLITIIKNFSFPEREIRTIISFLSYLGLFLKRVLEFKPSPIDTLLRPANEVFDYYLNYLIQQERLKDLRKSISGDKISLLDLGCHQGLLVKLALIEGIDAWGVDLNPNYNPRIITSSIEKLKIKQKFNLITLYHVLEHTKYPSQILQKVKPFLRKRGFLIIETPLVGNLSERILGKNSLAYQDPTHLHFFTLKKLRRIILQSGWKIEKEKNIWWSFFFYPLRVILKQKPPASFWGLVLFFPLKILTFLGINPEIKRFYCRLSS